MSYNEQLETNNASLEAVLLTLQSKASNTGGSGSGSLQVVTTAGSSTTYTATVDGIDALTVGAHFVMIPHVTSGKTAPKLNVNSLGEKTLRMVNPNNSYNTATPSNADWLRAGTPVLVMYNGTYWVTLGLPYISAESFNGTLPVTKGGTGATTAEQARTNLGIDSAVQTALEEAKASGDFDGEAGATFTPAMDGYWLTWSNDKGLANPDPTNLRGADGKTPVKGTDYFTAADKTEMVAAVKAAMSTFTLTGVDENDVEHTWTLYGLQS